MPGQPLPFWKTLLTDHPEYILIPLHPNTKIPLVKWGAYIHKRPAPGIIEHWFNYWPQADTALLTGAHTGLICLDYDLPPYPEQGLYTQTPSNGRHYFYPWQNDHEHSIACKPGLDIPYIVKLYAPPQINPLPLPVDITPHTRPKTPTLPINRQLAELRHFANCDFITWFQKQRLDTHWTGRYHLARAYASNMAFCTTPDFSLGPDYRHEDKIYASLQRPITCFRIWNYGYHCPNMDYPIGMCQKRAGISSPYGLALKQSRDPTND